MQDMWAQSLHQERTPGGGNGNPLQYLCLRNLMDREAWRATVHGVVKCTQAMYIFDHQMALVFRKPLVLTVIKYYSMEPFLITKLLLFPLLWRFFFSLKQHENKAALRSVIERVYLEKIEWIRRVWGIRIVLWFSDLLTLLQERLQLPVTKGQSCYKDLVK